MRAIASVSTVSTVLPPMSAAFSASTSATPERGFGEACDQRLEIGVLGDEVGFRVQLDRDADATRDGHADEAFGSGTVGLLGGFRETLGAQPVNRGFHVAIGFGQGFFRVHHACAGGFAQFFHHLGGDCHGGSPQLGNQMSRTGLTPVR